MFRSKSKNCFSFLKGDKFFEFDDDDDAPISSSSDACSTRQTIKENDANSKTTCVSNNLISFLHKFDFQSKTETLDGDPLEAIINDDKLKCKLNIQSSAPTNEISVTNATNIRQNVTLQDLSSTKNCDKELVENEFPSTLIAKVQSSDALHKAADDDDAFFDDDLSFDVFVNNEFNDNFSDNEVKESFSKSTGSSTLEQEYKKLAIITNSSKSHQTNKTNFFQNLNRSNEKQFVLNEDVRPETDSESMLGQSLVMNENINSSFKNSFISTVSSCEKNLTEPPSTLTQNVNKNLSFQENKTDDNFLSLIFNSPPKTSKNFPENKELALKEMQDWSDTSPKKLQKWGNSLISNEIQQYSTPIPTRKLSINFNNSNSRKRKFPGPAGLLPDLPPNSPLTTKDYEHCLQLNNSEQTYDQELLCSQGNNDFLSTSWCNMVKDLGSQSPSLFGNFNVKSIKMKAAKKKLPKFVEVPFFCALTKSVCLSENEFKVILKDETGEISGKVEQEVCDKFSTLLHVGSVLVLKNVKFLLNQLIIKLNNIIRIYRSDGEAVDINEWNYINSITLEKSSISPDDKPSCSKNSVNKTESHTSSEQCNYVVDFMDESVFEDDFNDIMCSIDESSFIS